MNAFIIVDVQNDFLPGGALAVPNGDRVIPAINRLMDRFELVVATRDWHPAEHKSYAVNHPGREVGHVIDLNGLPQVLWPVHCVAGTRGAEFAPGLNVSKIDRVFKKGDDPGIDSYSGFFDNGHRKSTGLGEFLEARGMGDVYIAGLATDYCVKFTALDAVELGFGAHVIIDACRGVNLRPGDADAAIAEMNAAGVRVIRSRDVEAKKLENAI